MTRSSELRLPQLRHVVAVRRCSTCSCQHCCPDIKGASSREKQVDVSTFCPYSGSMAKTGRPKKAAGTAKADYIEVRCEETEKQAFRAAAEAVGLPLSGWIRERLRRAARKELAE